MRLGVALGRLLTFNRVKPRVLRNSRTTDFGFRREKARSAEKAGHYNEAEEIWLNLMEDFPARDEPVTYGGRLAAGRVRSLLGEGRVAEARNMFDTLPSRLRKSLDVLLVWADLVEEGHKRDEILSRAAGLFPDRVEPYRLRIRAAEQSGRIDLAIAIANDMARRVPERDEGWRSLARLSKKSGDAAGAERALLQGGEAAYSYRISRDLSKLLFDAGRNEEALAEAQKAYAARPDDAEIAGALAQVLLRTRGEDAAFAVLAPLWEAEPDDPELLRELAKLQVAAGREREARRSIARLARLEPRASATLGMRIWGLAKHRNSAKARELWSQHKKNNDFAVVNGDISDLTCYSNNLAPDRNLLRLSLVERNALLRLPYFLEYYRALGVERFVVVDNGSTDGSIEFLLDQSDVCLFHTEASFAAAGSGMRWVNGLMDLCPNEHWWLHADIDEFLVLPGGAKPLSRHIALLEQAGAELLPSFMLDMFPLTAAAGETYKSGQDPLLVSPWFDATYKFQGNLEPPFLTVSGGARDRFSARGSESQPLLVKTPLTRRVRYVNSHGTTPGRPAPMRGAFLHYKFIGNFRTQIRSEVTRQEHYNSASHYVLLEAGLERISIDFSWVGPHSLRYDAPSDLERLGIITSELDGAGRSNVFGG